jgi:hypothetical protein
VLLAVFWGWGEFRNSRSKKHIDYSTLEKYVRGEAKFSPRQKEHLKNCCLCQDTLAYVKDLDSNLSQGEKPPEGYWQKVHEEIRK